MKRSRVRAGLMLLGAALLATSLALAGCTAGRSSTSSASGAPAASAPRPGAASPGAASSGAAGDGSVAIGHRPEAATGADRSVVVTGTVTITASDPIASAHEAVTIVEAAGGRIDGRTETAAANGDRGSATLVLRIPASRLDATLGALKKLGRADQVQLDSSDVTAQTRDVDARITAARATITRLLQLESTATDTTNLIAIETAVGDRQAELESMEAQQRGLADQLSMSTVTLQLRSDASAPPITPADFWSGLGTGWTAFVGFWAGTLIGLGMALPWLGLLGLLGGGLAAGMRRRRRTHPEPTQSRAT